MRAYAERFGELHIVLRTARSLDVHDGNLHIHGIRATRLFAPFALAKRTRALIREKTIEIVSAQDPFEHGWAALSATQGTGAKLHVQIHTDFLSPWFLSPRGVSSVRMRVLNRIRIRLADRVLPRAAGIRVVSQRIKDSIEKRYGARIVPAAVVPITLQSEVPEAVPLPAHAFTFTLIAVSRLESEKRIGDLLAALARVHDHYPSVGLLIVGAGRERAALERQARRRGLQDSVLFLGERSDAWGLMRSAHGFIQASAYEGYGRTLIEAALARVPIITTDVGIVGEVFQGYRDVLAAPPGDPAALAVQIVGLIEDSQARHGLIMNAEEAAKAHLAAAGDMVTAIYENLEQTLRAPDTSGAAERLS